VENACFAHLLFYSPACWSLPVLLVAGPGARPAEPTAAPTAGAKLDIIEGGSSATYRVTEQFVGGLYE